MCLAFCEDMTRNEDYHFNLNRILLLAIGLWPYEQSKFSRFQFILFSGILISAIVFQLTVFLTSRCTLDLILKVLSTVLLFSIFLVKYIVFGIDIESVKDLLTQLRDIYDELKDNNEIAITNKYGYNAKCFTATLTMISMVCICYFVVQIWTAAILQINISEPYQLPLITEYFIDREKYFYLILLHVITAGCVGITVMLAIGTMLIAFFHHICGVFRIASYRIEHSINFSVIENSTKNETLIFEKIISAVNIHRRAMKLSTSMVNKLEIMYFGLIIFGVVTLSLNLFRFSQIASMKINFMEIIQPTIIIGTLIAYMFIANYLAQDIMDHCKDVFLNAYKIQWYLAPLRVQRLILFLLQTGAKDFTLNVRGVIVASLECFAALIKASVSYFTVIYSM